MKRLLKIVLLFLLTLAVVPSFVFAEEDTNVAKIVDTEYESLSAVVKCS